MKIHYFIVLCICVLSVLGCSNDEVWDNNVPKNHDVFFYEQRLYTPDIDTKIFWRIPAILQLSNGTILTVNDKRNNTINDLPGDIDIVSRISRDNGRTWSEYKIIAKNPMHRGYGDPGLVECLDGSVICFFVGDNGSLQSTEEEPINSYYMKSLDYGNTWSEPCSITSLIYGKDAINPECKIYKASFCASGNGLCLKEGAHKGRIMFAAAMFREKKDADIHFVGDYAMDNYVIYSDDNGTTWNVSEKAFVGGDEAKLIELPDGKILMSVRQYGARGYTISSDGGVTWTKQSYWSEIVTNSCNGDIIALELEGNPHHVLLHSLPNSMGRENVSIFFSYDNGNTWQNPVCICNGPSCYSSLTMLKDGTIAAFVEKGDDSGYLELWYMNFSYEWLISQIRK